jgi:hypothetical protein
MEASAVTTRGFKALIGKEKPHLGCQRVLSAFAEREQSDAALLAFCRREGRRCDAPGIGSFSF